MLCIIIRLATKYGTIYEGVIYMAIKLAQTYDIESIMNYVTQHVEDVFGRPVTAETIHEFKFTVLEHIMRQEAKIKLHNNQIVGLVLN